MGASRRVRGDFSRRLVSEHAQAPGAYWLCRHNTGASSRAGRVFIALWRDRCQDRDTTTSDDLTGALERLETGLRQHEHYLVGVDEAL